MPSDEPSRGGAGSGPTASGEPDRGDSNPFWTHVSRATDRFRDVLPFASIPLVLTLVEVGNVGAALDPSPRHYSVDVKFVFPSTMLDLWQVVDPPESSSRITAGQPAATTPSPIDVSSVSIGLDSGWGVVALGVVGLYVLFAGVLSAIYVGGLDRRLRGEPIAGGELIVRYAPLFVLYQLVLIGAVLVAVPFLLVSPALVVLLLPVVLVLGYLFYAAPFLFVVEDAPFVDAFRRSYGFATDGGAYLSFGLWHLGLVALVSVACSMLLNAGALGFLLALAVVVPLSLVLTTATVSFLQELVDAERHAV